MKPTITACVITLNEERNIGKCLESVSWCDEIVVVDSGSTDRTVEQASKYTSKIIRHQWQGYRDQKEFAFSHATSDWIFEIDADEMCSDTLKSELMRMLSRETTHDGFWVLRRNHYMGQWLKHGGMYPDRILRIFKRGAGEMKGSVVHHFTSVKGTTGTLSGWIDHFTYPTFSSHIQKISTQVRTESGDRHRNGARFSALRLVAHPAYRFFTMYFLKFGFLDGLPGLFAATTFSFGTMARYAYLFEFSLPGSRDQNTVS